MKKILGIVVLVFSLSTKAFAFCIIFCDPDVEGCVYGVDFGNLIDCVSIDYNEAKRPGSLKAAEQLCFSMLRESAYEAGESNFSIEGCFDMSPRY